jgi:hypothetical protein
MTPGLQSFNRLLADQAVAASTTLVDLGTGASLFQFVVPAGKQFLVKAVLPFSVGATGGFKFQLTSSQTLVDYSAAWLAVDGVTPGNPVTLELAASGPFANAWASAGSHLCELFASLKGHATLSSTVTVQFACNSAANAITVLKGAQIQVIQVS